MISQEVINTETRLTFNALWFVLRSSYIHMFFLPMCWENTFSFSMQKSINTAVVTEQTTEAFDWKLIGFIYRGRIHWNFSHSILMVCIRVALCLNPIKAWINSLWYITNPTSASEFPKRAATNLANSALGKFEMSHYSGNTVARCFLYDCALFLIFYCNWVIRTSESAGHAMY